MRVNVYNEELTSDTKIETKEAQGKMYYGIRFFLHSSELLHKGPDDDRSAVTFWARTPDQLEDILSKALETVKAYKPK